MAYYPAMTCVIITATVLMTYQISVFFSDADDQLFSRISHNATLVLKPLLPCTLNTAII